MSKGGSGHFSGTLGTTTNIWKQITPTQPNYPGTVIPRSFIIKTLNYTFWVHGNATEHIADYLNKQSKEGHSQGSTKIEAQIILSDMHISLSKVTEKGIHYNTSLKHGNWEFVIKASRNKSEYDIIIHAMYKK